MLANELTREALIEAHRARFYATEHKDLHLDVRCAGFPMGSRLHGVPRQFTVTARDAGGDGFSALRIYRDGVLIDVSSVAGGDVSTTFTDSNAPSGGAYYYAIVQQTDDNDGNGRNDEAISSPIWVDRDGVVARRHRSAAFSTGRGRDHAHLAARVSTCSTNSVLALVYASRSSRWRAARERFSSAYARTASGWARR